MIDVKDGDTYLVKQDNTVYTVRLHWADCPEIAHNSKQVNQPFGQDAKAYMIKNYLHHIVIVTPKDISYGRIVGDVKYYSADAKVTDVAEDLVSKGLAQIDMRFHPSTVLIKDQDTAKNQKLGIWSQPNPVSPQDWRANGYKPKTTN